MASVFVMSFRALLKVNYIHNILPGQDAKFYLECGDWTVAFFSRSVSFEGPFFKLKSGSVTECNLCGRRKKGRGWGICNTNSLSL